MEELLRPSLGQKTDPNYESVASDLSLRVTLPPRTCVQKTTSFDGPATAVVTDGNIYWVDFNFDKKGKRCFSLKARVELDYTNMTVPVQVTAYSVANNCTTTATTLNIPVVQVGKLSHARRRTRVACVFFRRPPQPKPQIRSLRADRDKGARRQS